MKKSNAPALRSETSELELPDWSGMKTFPNQLAVDKAFELCEQYALWFAKARPKRRREPRAKCVVEFSL
jgi:hypothetical protein